MKQAVVFDTDYGFIKDQLLALKGEKITVMEHRTKNKHYLRRGVLTTVSDNLFCFDVPLGKDHIESMSYTFYDIKMRRVEIKEIKL